MGNLTLCNIIQRCIDYLQLRRKRSTNSISSHLFLREWETIIHTNTKTCALNYVTHTQTQVLDMSIYPNILHVMNTNSGLKDLFRIWTQIQGHDNIPQLKKHFNFFFLYKFVYTYLDNIYFKLTYLHVLNYFFQTYLSSYIT